MPDTLSLTIGGSLSGTLADTIRSRTTSSTQAAPGVFVKLITCTEAAEADLDLTGVTTPGVIYLRNTDADNFITYGPKVGGVMEGFAELKPGEQAALRLTRTSPTLRWRADTADVDVEVRLYND